MRLKALAASLALACILSVMPAAKAVAATPVTIVVPANSIQLGRTNSRGNVEPLAKQQLPNGEYTAHLEVTTTGDLHPGNHILINSGNTNSGGYAFSDVQKTPFYSKTAGPTIKIKGGTLFVAVALGLDKVFTGSVKLVITPVQAAPQPQTAAAQTPHRPTQPQVQVATTTLPSTGASQLAGIFAGTVTLGYAVHRHTTRKKHL